MASAFRTFQLILRIIQFVFAIIAFSAAAWLLDNRPTAGFDPIAGYWSLSVSAIQFMIFTGVVAMVITMVYMPAYFSQRMQKLLGLVEVVLDALWVIFWLSAAAAFSAQPVCKPALKDLGLTNCGTFLASAAFAWLSWIFWVASLVMAVVDMRRGEGITGGAKRYPTGRAPELQMQV